MACVIFAYLLALATLGAQETDRVKRANLYYDQDDYGRAYVHYQDLIVDNVLSGEILYRYGYSYEQIRDFDEIAMKIYALSRYYFERESRENVTYALYAAHKLVDNPALARLDETAAALLLKELRESIDKERKARLYRFSVTLPQPFSSFLLLFSSKFRFSIFQLKVAISIAMTLPFIIGVLVLKGKERKSHTK
jgi:hypothetical protein